MISKGRNFSSAQSTKALQNPKPKVLHQAPIYLPIYGCASTSIPSSQTVTDIMDNKTSRDNISGFESSEKYARLEDLLRQTITLAEEIVESRPHETLAPSATSHQLPAECITLWKTSRSGPVSSPYYTHLSSPVVANRKRLYTGEDSESGTSVAPTPSAASSIQEPFSPGSLALSLDAIVEGKRCDSEMCCLDTSSTANLASGRIPELAMSPRPSMPSTILDSQHAHHLTDGIKPSQGMGGFGERSIQSQVPPRWHTCTLPVTSSVRTREILCSPAPSVSSAFVKVEAVLPCRIFGGTNVGATSWNSEGSYITIRWPPLDVASGNGMEDTSGHVRGHEHRPQARSERSLQNLIDEWDYSAGPLELEERKGGEMHVEK